MEPYLSPCTKLNPKCIKDFNINLITLIVRDEKVRSTLEHIDMEDHFLNITLVAQTMRATINK